MDLSSSWILELGILNLGSVPKRITRNMEHGSWNLGYGNWNLKYDTWKPEYDNWNLELELGTCILNLGIPTCKLNLKGGTWNWNLNLNLELETWNLNLNIELWTSKMKRGYLNSVLGLGIWIWNLDLKLGNWDWYIETCGLTDPWYIIESETVVWMRRQLHFLHIRCTEHVKVPNKNSVWWGTWKI